MWRETRRVLAAEWLKLRHSRAWPAGLLVYLAVLAVLYITYEIASEQSFIGIRSGFFVAGAVLSSAVTPLTFVALLLSAFGLGREFSQGTIHLVWSRPLSRTGWLLGKILSAMLHLAIYGILTLLLVLLVTKLRIGFTDLMEKDYLIHSQSSLWWRLVLTSALTGTALMAVVVVAAVPVLYLSSPGTALTVSLAAGFILQVAAGWDVLHPFLLSTYLTLPLDQFVAMSNGLPLPEEWGALVRMCLTGSFAWAAMGWGWSLWLVRRKEVPG